jgi:hypothetical protein
MGHVGESDWAPRVVCRPIFQLRACLDDYDCTTLLKEKVVNGTVRGMHLIITRIIYRHRRHSHCRPPFGDP